MRLVGIGLAGLLLVVAPHARADEPPVVVEPPLPELPTQKPPPPAEPSPVKIEMPEGTTPPPPPPAAPAPAPAPPPVQAAPAPPKRASFTELGVGPVYLGAIRKSDTFSQAGVMFQVGARTPIADHFGIGFRFGYGLTGWERSEDLAHAGYSVGKWTTHAYRDVWNWAGEGEKDTRLLRYMAAFFGFVGLIFPLVISGAFYVASPFAASSIGEFDLTFHWEPSNDPKQGPYLKGGLGLMGYIHPHSGHAYGGLGPNFGFGYRADNIILGLVGTFLPYGAHGGDVPEHILVGAATIGLVH